MTHPTERIRNVVLVGHGGAGKTTLAESLLARAGAVTRAGAVDDGTSLLDHEPESVKRRISLTMALAPFDWTARDGQTYRINLMDTPGYVDFEGQVDTALGVADLAVFVVSAVDGVEVRTERLWRRCAALGIPRMVFVNKEDRERADFHGVFDQLTAAFGGGFVALEEPDGEAAALSGVTDLLTEEGHRLHGAVVEEIVSGDDEQLERYLGGEAPSTADLERTLAHEVLDGLEFPVLLGSATTGVGIDRLADYICEIGPSPADRPATIIAGDARSSVMADATAPTLLHVFATVSDPYVGQLSLFKVLSGTVRTDDRLVNSTTGTEERLHALFTVRGKEQQPVTEVTAGGIAAVAKLSATRTGDALAPKGTPVRVVQPEIAIPQYSVAIVPRTPRRHSRPSSVAPVTHTSPSPSNASPASSVSTSTSLPYGSRTARRSPRRPTSRARSRSRAGDTVSSPWSTSGCHHWSVETASDSPMPSSVERAAALRDALEAGGVTVLEPVSRVTVTVPSTLQGDVMSDITNRRGRVLASTTDEHGHQGGEALVPAAELTHYSIDLRSLTGGRGRFESWHDRYEALPAHLVDAAKKSLAA